MADLIYSPLGLPGFRLYVENQGDKFHPLSDELLSTLRSSVEQGVSDGLILERVLKLIGDYEADPASDSHHRYHTDKLRGYLLAEEDLHG